MRTLKKTKKIRKRSNECGGTITNGGRTYVGEEQVQGRRRVQRESGKQRGQGRVHNTKVNES